VTESARSTAGLIVECLENEGVTHVFGIPGEETIRLVDAISRSSVRYVLARHEQGASFMAEVYGRLTGRAGVCSATLGPGAINLLLGTADATTNSTPLIALSAQVGMNRSFKESHQGVDLVSMFAPAVKWSALVATPGAVPEMIRKAFKLAQTALRLGLAFVILTWVDNAYGLISWKMDLEIGRDVDTRFGNPDFVAYAESFGATGYRITAPGELLPAPRTALAAETVSVIACPVDYSANLELIESLGDLDESLS